ncbi:FAD-dependent thymidylate synthase [Nonomuraea jabiensis]|uniref:FAD-dependent thymidylate synthase n=1 Tax=Nonomuraea jabiensis TaxID=882448 RepID=UPI003D7092CF
MQVHLVAHTIFHDGFFESQTGLLTDIYTQPADALAEAAGRLCYKAWERKNPATATNEGYLANIIEHQHFSVLEHASATFLIQGVSRSLLAELTRHRHLSFSVESQRYVDQADREPVIPPAARGTDAEASIRFGHTRATLAYLELVSYFKDELGLPKKQANEAARALLPNCQPVDLVVTGNLRAWREVLTKRYHMAADAEIRELAAELLKQLTVIAPNSFQDFGLGPIGNEEIRRAAA